MQRMLSKEQLLAQMQDDWNRDVGQWRDAELEKGSVYTFEISSSVPLLGNTQIPAIGQYEYLGRANCNALEKSMIDLLQFPEKSKALVRAGYHLVMEDFSVKRMVTDTEKLYRSLAKT